jgi:hypothetical protein
MLDEKERKELLVAAAKKAAKKVRVLSLLIPIARRWHSAEIRAGIYLEAFKIRVCRMMLLAKLHQTHGKDSLATLVANTTMGKDAKGAKAYRRLVKRYGATWVHESVTVTVARYPESYALQFEKIGSRLVPLPPKHVAARTETVYVFHRKGTTLEELEWTQAMGNKITVRLGPLTKNYKEGLERNSHKKTA